MFDNKKATNLTQYQRALPSGSFANIQ